MFETKVDQTRNLLTIHYWQDVEPDEVKRFAGELPGLLLNLRPGFSLLADMSNLDSMHVGCVAHLKTIMDLCNQKKVSTIVRIIPDPRKDIGLNILSLFHYDRGVQIVTCRTLEEGLQILQ
jgi:hypothetical protein